MLKTIEAFKNPGLHLYVLYRNVYCYIKLLYNKLCFVVLLEYIWMTKKSILQE